MDCSEVLRLLDAYAAGELPLDSAGGLKSHLDVCRACSEALDGYLDAREAIAEAADDVPVADAAFFRSLSKRLDEADRGAGVVRTRSVRWHFVGAVAASAAAVLILATMVVPRFYPAQPAGQGAELSSQPYLLITPSATYKVVGATEFPGTQPSAPAFYFTYPNYMQAFSEGGYVSALEYRRLEKRVETLESRLTALEAGRGGSASK